jgi:hypothetical protein
MEERVGIVQRAFQVAKSGKVSSVIALRAQLTGEGYLNTAQALAGRSILNQLTRMIFAAQMSKSPAFCDPQVSE